MSHEILIRGRSVSPARTDDSSPDAGDPRGDRTARSDKDQSMDGWGANRSRAKKGVEVARRNLRLHERNHSWAHFPKVNGPPLQEDDADDGFWPSRSSLMQAPAAEMRWFEPNHAGDGVNVVCSPKGTEETTTYHSIMMISDFFFPDAGGVENHMFMLSQCLLQLGHKVIVCTRARGQRQGVRWLKGGLKVYYLPFMPMPDVFSSGRVSLPTLFSSFPILRNICIRERVSIVHGHQAFSILCHEGLMHAGTMGLKVIFTDHSLFGFSDPSAIHMNKVLNFTCSITNHVICVSHTSKENTVLRANILPSDVSVIPNAVDCTAFTPNPAARKSNSITIVCLTRLVYRKGVDLMVEIIPAICKHFDHVNFIIGGDGPMRVALEQMRENHQLQDRVEMLGAVRHKDVRNVLVRGHIYLNCSLTEAFCIAILEAASCGLLVVSTKVGGVPEVMPSQMIKYAPPDPKELTRVLARAIVKDVKDVVPHEFHDNVRRMYSWRDVALRTIKVYDKVVRDEPIPLLKRLQGTFSRGPVFGILISLLVAIDYLFWRFLCWLFPEEDIEVAVDFPNPCRPAHLRHTGSSGDQDRRSSVGAYSHAAQAYQISSGAGGAGGMVGSNKGGGGAFGATSLGGGLVVGGSKAGGGATLVNGGVNGSGLLVQTLKGSGSNVYSGEESEEALTDESSDSLAAEEELWLQQRQRLSGTAGGSGGLGTGHERGKDRREFEAAHGSSTKGGQGVEVSGGRSAGAREEDDDGRQRAGSDKVDAVQVRRGSEKRGGGGNGGDGNSSHGQGREISSGAAGDRLREVARAGEHGRDDGQVNGGGQEGGMARDTAATSSHVGVEGERGGEDRAGAAGDADLRGGSVGGEGQVRPRRRARAEASGDDWKAFLGPVANGRSF